MITSQGNSLIKEAISIDSIRKGLSLTAAGVTVGLFLKDQINKIMNDTRKKALIEDLMRTDPVIKEEDPEKVMSYYVTLNKFAPTVATDKNAVREILQGCVKFGTFDIQTLKHLADMEKTLKDSNKTFDANHINLLSVINKIGD